MTGCGAPRHDGQDEPSRTTLDGAGNDCIGPSGHTGTTGTTGTDAIVPERMQRRSMGGHQSPDALSETWLTPPEIIEALGAFDLDPCAAPEPRPWPTAKRHIARPDDGLHAAWEGRVWLNPPYSRDAVRWLQRMAAHGNGTALVFARTETSWFWETVWLKATAVLFMAGRVYFYRPNGQRAPANSGAPSVLAGYGDRDASMLAKSGLPGAYARDWLLTGECRPPALQVPLFDGDAA